MLYSAPQHIVFCIRESQFNNLGCAVKLKKVFLFSLLSPSMILIENKNTGRNKEL